MTMDAAGASKVGVRELKAKLSEHLARVKAGATVTVTERGRPVARLVPVEEVEIPAHIKAMIESGEVRWSGLRPLPFEPIKPRPGAPDRPNLADMISEGREDRF